MLATQKPILSLQRKSPDPGVAVRISLGGGDPLKGYFCVYRGSREEVLDCLRAAISHLEGLTEDPPIITETET